MDSKNAIEKIPDNTVKLVFFSTKIYTKNFLYILKFTWYAIFGVIIGFLIFYAGITLLLVGIYRIGTILTFLGLVLFVHAYWKQVISQPVISLFTRDIINSERLSPITYISKTKKRGKDLLILLLILIGITILNIVILPEIIGRAILGSFHLHTEKVTYLTREVIYLFTILLTQFNMVIFALDEAKPLDALKKSFKISACNFKKFIIFFLIFSAVLNFFIIPMLLNNLMSPIKMILDYFGYGNVNLSASILIDKIFMPMVEPNTGFVTEFSKKVISRYLFSEFILVYVCYPLLLILWTLVYLKISYKRDLEKA